MRHILVTRLQIYVLEIHSLLELIILSCGKEVVLLNYHFVVI